MAKKRVSDLLALGLALISFWIITIFTGVFIELGRWSGFIGALITLVVEGYFLIKTWGRR